MTLSRILLWAYIVISCVLALYISDRINDPTETYQQLLQRNDQIRITIVFAFLWPIWIPLNILHTLT